MKGVHHWEGPVFVAAGDLIPGSRATAATHTDAKSSGGPLGAPVSAFGPVAVAMTDTGARAFSESGAMLTHIDDAADPGRAHAYGATTQVWDVGAGVLRRGSGKTRDVFTDRWAGAGVPRSRTLPPQLPAGD